MTQPTMNVPVPDVDELELDKYTASGRTAKELVDRRQSLKDEIALCEQEIKDLDTELGLACDMRNVKNAVCGNWLIIRRQGSKPRATLDRVLLLEAGVTPQQLEMGTKLSEQGKPGITIQDLSKTTTNRFNHNIEES